jgi:uncharacterized protein YchJ
VRELSRIKDTRRFMGLRIVEADGDEVLFEARVFEKGVGRSLAELSRFVREEGRWKYAEGRAMAVKALPKGFSREHLLAVDPPQ